MWPLGLQHPVLFHRLLLITRIKAEFLWTGFVFTMKLYEMFLGHQRPDGWIKTIFRQDWLRTRHMKSFGTCMFWGSIDQFVYASKKKAHCGLEQHKHTSRRGKGSLWKAHPNTWNAEQVKISLFASVIKFLHHRVSWPFLCLTVAFAAHLGYSSVSLSDCFTAQQERNACCLYPMICQQMENSPPDILLNWSILRQW